MTQTAQETYAPPKAFTEKARIKDFAAYKAMYERSLSDPDGFWSEIASEFHWEKKWDRVVSYNFDRRKGPISVKWFEGGVNESRAPDEHMDVRPTQTLSLEIIPADRTLNDMLETGEIDAYFGARRPEALDNGQNVARLFPNYRELEKDYYRKTGFHPIMHTVVIREELFQEHPWMAESLYKACEDAKAWAVKQMKFSGAQRLMLPWLFDEIAEMEELMGKNAWAYGLEANRPILESFMRYLVDQHFLEKPAPIDDLFAPIISWSE